MQIIANYQLKRKLSSSLYFNIYRGIRRDDKTHVIIKIPKTEHPSPVEITALEHEYSMLKKQLQGVVQPQDLIHQGNYPILILENSKGISLKDYLLNKSLSLDQFFDLAVQLTEIIANLHKHNIIHKDITPANILIDPKTFKLQLLDLSFSTQLSEEMQDYFNLDKFEGSPAYMSPEQTGRTNRPVDYRTDLYSLGITLFEMVTGRLPFPNLETLELVHCHLAKKPPKASDLSPQVPTMVSNIIEKLLSKLPEQRYASVAGVKADLTKCQKEWIEHQKIEPFILGTQDIYDHLHTSHKLYGREKEVKELTKAIEQVKEGQSKIVFIAGYSGIGKSSLVREAQKTIPIKNGYFIQGKFEQLTRGTPYSAFIDAFQELEKKLLSETDQQLRPLKEKLQSDLSYIGQVIVKLIPGFEAIIGPQAAFEELNPAEMQNRFIAAFNKFIQAFNETNRVLVIFLDDLHWADMASLKLIEDLLTNNRNVKLLIIGAYRDNEVDANHPLYITQNKLIESGIENSTVTLTPLKKEQVNELISDTLRRSLDEVAELSTIIGEKTGSNPFFINEFLKIINHENLIYYSYANHEWTWDTQKILEHPMTDNVIDLLTKKLSRLSAHALEILRLSACIGYRFDLKNLEIISGKSKTEVKKALWEAIQLNLIMPLHNAQSVDMIEDDAKIHVGSENIEYQFIHDRIQQAVYQTLSLNERKIVHFNIAKILLSEKPLSYEDERLFLIVNHLDQCLPLITSVEDKITFAEYFLWAGMKSKESVAFATAMNYLKSGIFLISHLSNQTRDINTLIFSLHKTHAECSYITGKFDEAHQELDHLLKQNISKFQASELYSLKLLIYSVENKHQQGIENGIKALKGLGVNIPEHPSVLQILFQVFKVFVLLRGRNIANIIDKLPVAEDAAQKARIYLLVQIVGSAYSINPNLVAYCIAKSISLSLRYGITAYTNLAGFAVLLVSELGMVKAGFKFFQAQEKIHNVWNSIVVNSKYYTARGLFFDHWFFPLSVGLENARKAYQYSVGAGDSAFAGYSKYGSIYNLRAKGTSLDESIKEIEAAFAALNYIHDEEYFNIISLEQNIYAQLKTGQVSEEELFNSYLRCANKSSSIVKRFAHITFGQMNYILGNYKLAFKTMKETDSLEKFARPFIWNQDLWAIYSILIVNEYPNMSRWEKFVFKRRLLKFYKELKHWNNVFPLNIQHKYLLVQAELKRLAGDLTAAGDLYDAAIKAASQANFYNYVGIINERAAHLYLELNKCQFASHYLLEAYYAYKNWGAAFKCKQMEKIYPKLFSSQNNAVTETVVNHASSLDLAAILKANQVISREINLNNILEKIMHVALEEAGAESSMLIRKQDDNWVVEARQEADKLTIYENESVTSNSKEIPLNLVNYVQRTREAFVAQDLSLSSEIAPDEYLQLKKPKSVIALPILYQNEIKRILYLENSTVTNAFTPQQVGSLKMLASQVAISLENADYYEKSGRFVPFEFLNRLNKNSYIDVRLGDQVKSSLSVLFCDIRSFTTISENLSPEETLAFVNEFWEMLEPIITSHGGFIDKYIGDAIMVLFEDPPDQAVKAALEITKALDRYNQARQVRNLAPVNIGIGINSGDVILGIVGTEKRMNTTVMGDVVNVASRIEDLTKQFNTPILISEATRLKLKSPELFDLNLIDKILIRGTSTYTKIWEVRRKILASFLH